MLVAREDLNSTTEQVENAPLHTGNEGILEMHLNHYLVCTCTTVCCDLSLYLHKSCHMK